MNIRVKIDSIKEAERFSSICQQFPAEFFLRGDHFCTDPKSALGILAIMYSAGERMYIDTGSMEDGMISNFINKIAPYIAG